MFVSGCWDNKEVSELSLELAWGIDKAPNNKVKISAQTIIPSKIASQQPSDQGQGGNNGEPYYTVSSSGKNTLDAVQQMQTKLSRSIFRGHRKVIVIGEPMARQGIKEVFDTYTRDPNLKLRTDIFVIKGSSAERFLKTSYPFEAIPGLGVLGEQNQTGTPKELVMLHFLLTATSEGASPTVPAIAYGMNSSSSSSEGDDQKDRSRSDKEGFRIVGTAIFNKELKLVGYLNLEESRSMRWVAGRQNKLTVSTTIPDEEGNVSMDLYKIGRKIHTTHVGNRLKILITLTGKGAIRENNTQLDLTNPNNVALVQNAVNKQVEKNVLRTITKVQQNYGTDVFGFSEAIRTKKLPLWKSIRNNWETEFREADVSVHSTLKVRRIGVTGPSLLLKKNEIKK